MVIANIGPATTMVEVGAASVAAGIVLGGFAGGGIGLLMQWPRSDLEARVLSDSYMGGFVGLAALAIDLAVRYAL